MARPTKQNYSYEIFDLVGQLIFLLTLFIHSNIMVHSYILQLHRPHANTAQTITLHIVFSFNMQLEL